MDEEYPEPPGAGQGLPPGQDPPPTGDDRVDGAVAGLRRLPGLPPEAHVAVLRDVHGQLRDILGELGAEPARDRP